MQEVPSPSWARRESRRMSGFKNRKRRVARRAERDTFREIVMPAGYLLGALGFLGLLAVAVQFSTTGDAVFEIAGVAAGLVALPFLLLGYRVMRGHYSDALDEP